MVMYSLMCFPKTPITAISKHFQYLRQLICFLQPQHFHDDPVS